MTLDGQTQAVGVIVLNWNGKQDTLECLRSLSAMAYPNYRVVVVDNGSIDDSVATIRREFPSVTVLETRQNLGYAAGNNVGIRYCLGDTSVKFLLVLNNDTIVHSSLLTALVATADSMPQVGVFGPKIYFHGNDERIWFAGGQWDANTSTFIHPGHGEKDEHAVSTVSETDFVTGCALFTRASTMKRIGLFDERFFLTFEDVDWCYRARRAGERCAYVPGAIVWHKVSASFGRGGSALYVYFWTRNRLLWARLHLRLVPRLKLYVDALSALLLPDLTLHKQDRVPLHKRIYWSLATRSGWDFSKYGTPSYRASIYGLRDYLRRRFGDCPHDVRRRFSRT